MINLKLKTIANLINIDDYVIDIGCDHAYLAIYLKENEICGDVIATDISSKVIMTAKKNIQSRGLNIETYVADGFLNIDNKNINTAVISGMGTTTILGIVNNASSNITKYIISSNNDYELLRNTMYKNGLYISKEVVIEEKNKYYPIMVFTKKCVLENRITLKYGKSANKNYYSYLLEKEKIILNSIPKRHILKRLKHIRNIWDLKKLIK